MKNEAFYQYIRLQCERMLLPAGDSADDAICDAMDEWCDKMTPQEVQMVDDFLELINTLDD